MIWKLYNKALKKYPISENHEPFVVLGFQRSGTSLIGQLLSNAGVFFGEAKEMKKIDFRNPKGFAENEPLFKPLRAMLSQAGCKNDFGSIGGLEAKGGWNKFLRMFSRISLQQSLSNLSKKEKWGLKSFPVFFYYLKPYLPAKTKIIAIYRDPWSVAESFMKAWAGGRYTFDQVFEIWAKANRDLLFHLSSFDSILVSYNDLLDPQKQGELLKKMAVFSGLNENKFSTGVDQSLNRSSKSADRLKGALPLPVEVKSVFDSLENLKLKP